MNARTVSRKRETLRVSSKWYTIPVPLLPDPDPHLLFGSLKSSPTGSTRFLARRGGGAAAQQAVAMGTDPPASVMVAVRCRPMNTRELNQKEAKIVTIKENGYASVQSEDEMQGLREFSFDYTYDDDSLQLTVYENLGRPMLDKAFDGWNGTIFAYGQTGAGKSFSMTGTNDLPGIIPQMNVDMFQRISQSQTANPEKKFLVTCSFMEIYNEVLYDLLDPSGGRGTK